MSSSSTKSETMSVRPEPEEWLAKVVDLFRNRSLLPTYSLLEASSPEAANTAEPNDRLSTETRFDAESVRQEASRIADFVMFTQRSFLLNLSKEINKRNISFAQFFLLGYLAKAEHLMMIDITKKMGHSTAAATGLVDRLENLGYVQRHHASDDTRKVMVQITRKGVDLVERTREGIVDSLVPLMDNLKEDQKLAILRTHANPAAETNEESLVESITYGQTKEFWLEYQALKKKAEQSDLSDVMAKQLASMANQIEGSDANRLAAADKLAKLRGVTFDDIVTEYEIGVVAS